MMPLSIRPYGPAPLPALRGALALALVAALLAGGAVLAAGSALFLAPPTPFAEARIVRIEPGTSSRRIARMLEEAGVIPSAQAFNAYIGWTKVAPSLRAGLYRFERPLSAAQAAARLRAGSPELMAVTIPEGLTLDETAFLLSQAGIADESSLREAFRDVTLLPPSLGDAAVESLEGFLFPDTYKFTPVETPAAIARIMTARFEAVFSRLLAETPPPEGRSALDAVTLAALVEKETRHDDERALVASVYWNRLRIRMPLQCDPTVIYAMKLDGSWRGFLSRAHLREVESRYNTYRWPGLPPGPIANPGEASLRAALDPAETRYLYFVARTDGRHHFSESLGEHNRAVHLYRSRGLSVEEAERRLR